MADYGRMIDSKKLEKHADKTKFPNKKLQIPDILCDFFFDSTVQSTFGIFYVFRVDYTHGQFIDNVLFLCFI